MVHLSLMPDAEFYNTFHAEKASDMEGKEADLKKRVVRRLLLPLLSSACLLLYENWHYVQAIVGGYGWALAPLLVKGGVPVYFYAGVTGVSLLAMMHTERSGRQMWNGALFPHMVRGFLPSLISVLLVGVLFVDTFLVEEAATSLDDFLAGNIEPGTPCESKAISMLADDNFRDATFPAFLKYTTGSDSTGPKHHLSVHPVPIHFRQARDGSDEEFLANCTTLSTVEDIRKCHLKNCKTEADAPCFARLNTALDTPHGSIFSVPEERLHFTFAAGQDEAVISDAFALNFTSFSCYSWRITQLTLVDVIEKLPEIGSAGIIVMVTAKLSETLIASVLEKWRGFPLFFTPASSPETVSEFLLAQQHFVKLVTDPRILRRFLIMMPGPMSLYLSLILPPSTSTVLNVSCLMVGVFMCCFTFAYSLEGPCVLTKNLFFEGEDTFTHEGKTLKLSLADWLSLSQLQKATLIVNYCATVTIDQKSHSEVRLRQTTRFDQAFEKEKADETWLRRIEVKEFTTGKIKGDGRVPGTFCVEFDGIIGEAVEVDGNLLAEHCDKWRAVFKLLEQLAPPSDTRADSSERDVLVSAD